jgi:hypothetical protein
VEVVDLATTKVPYPHYREYTIKPRPFSSLCLPKLQLTSNEYRNFKARDEGRPLELMCRINHGHIAEPSLSIRVKKAKNSKDPSKLQELYSFMLADFTWAPRIYVSKSENGSPCCQLQDCMAYTLEQCNKLDGVK